MCQKLLKGQKGFTLLEMLLVLFILLLVCSITSHIILKSFEKQGVEQFFDILELDIQRMQTLAMKEQTKTTIVFLDDDSYKGYVQTEYFNPVFEKKLPKGITLNNYSNLKRISFDINGEVSNFGKIIFYTPLGDREVIVNIEKGRVRVNGQ